MIADDLEVARDDLARDWSIEHRQAWAIDSGTPSTDPAEVEANTRAPATMRAALLQARLIAERSAVSSAIPVDVSAELADQRAKLAAVKGSLSNLETGGGEWAGTKVGEVARIEGETEQRRKYLEWELRTKKGGEGTRLEDRTGHSTFRSAGLNLGRSTRPTPTPTRDHDYHLAPSRGREGHGSRHA